MRVLHVIPAVAPRYGGPSSAIVPLCRTLVAHGIDPFIATTTADGPHDLAVPIGEQTAWHNVPARFFPRHFGESLKYSNQLAKWLDASVASFDVVHIHGVFSHASLAAASACSRRDVPYIVRPFGTLAPWSLQQKAVKKRVFLALVGLRMLRRAAAVHYTSEVEKRAVEHALGLSGGVVIPLGIDQAWLDAPTLSDAERDRDRYVLSLSRIHPKKNLDVLIRSFADVTGRGAGRWRLVVAGTGEPAYVRALQRLAADLGASDRIRFVGWIDGDEKRDVVCRASIFSLYSKHENFGLAALEAVAVGVPAMLSPAVDLAERVAHADAGWVVEGTDALRRTLAAAFADPDSRHAKGRAGRMLARRFAWPLVAEQLTDMYAAYARVNV
jgi:glycosyltransferase involved in cell wall biosynthesis